jgi:hypothetical protein
MRRISALARKQQLRPHGAEAHEVGMSTFDVATSAHASGPEVISCATLDRSAILLPLARLLGRQAARQHLHRHRGYGMIQIAITLAVVSAFLIGALLLAQRLGGRL